MVGKTKLENIHYCGVKNTGCSRENVFLNGKYHDLMHMDILKNEFTGDFIKSVK